MDPYLEDPGGWTGVHDGLIAVLRATLNRLLGPDFVADAGTTVWVVAAGEQRWAFPDVSVVETQHAARGGERGRIAAPVQVLLDPPATVSQPHILIRDWASRRVVTVIEVLSPINKAPGTTQARQDFLRWRDETIASDTNWVEIDLLRAGERPPEVRIATTSPYYVLVKRVGEVRVGIWPIDLPERLPRVGIPLRADVSDIDLDVQPALDQVYADGRYDDLIDYTAPVPPPVLAPEAAQWAAEQVRAWFVARLGNGTGQP
jgi:hypothetical protein